EVCLLVVVFSGLQAYPPCISSMHILHPRFVKVLASSRANTLLFRHPVLPCKAHHLSAASQAECLTALSTSCFPDLDRHVLPLSPHQPLSLARKSELGG